MQHVYPVIRVKPQKPLRDVIMPILVKYSNSEELDNFRLFTNGQDGSENPVDFDDHAFKVDDKKLFLVRNNLSESAFNDSELKNESSRSLNVDRPLLARRSAFRTAKKKRKRRESFGLRRMLTKSKVTAELSPYQQEYVISKYKIIYSTFQEIFRCFSSLFFASR